MFLTTATITVMVANPKAVPRITKDLWTIFVTGYLMLFFRTYTETTRGYVTLIDLRMS